MEKLKTVQTMLYLGGTGFNETLTARDFLTFKWHLSMFILLYRSGLF